MFDLAQPNNWLTRSLPSPAFSQTPEAASSAPKDTRDEPFKLTPSGCFLSMWISRISRGESLLSRLCQFFLDLIRITLIRILQILRPFFSTCGTGTLACDPTCLVDRCRPRLRTFVTRSCVPFLALVAQALLPVAPLSSWTAGALACASFSRS